MKTLETSKLKRNELMFLVSAIGLVLILAIDLLTGIFSDKGLAHPRLALSMGGLLFYFYSGLFYLGFALF